MKIYDISMDISNDMAVYKNIDSKKPYIKVVRDFSNGSTYESRFDIDMHTGTHVDAPLHIIEGGGTVDNIDLSRLITKCKVLDFTGIDDKITEADLKGKNINKRDFIILKTMNSYTDEFDLRFIYLETRGAKYLESMEVSGVGIDALGIERDQPDHGTHKSLLGAGIIILEGLRLGIVPEGEYLLFAAPLKVKGAEAAPVRAVLLEE